MLDELLTELKVRENTIETLTSNGAITEERQRNYRFAFGNVSMVEEKLKKMTKIYTEKLTTCFDHYARTMGIVYSDCKRISIISDRLKQSEISSSKASGDLSVIATSLDSQINCFEKYFNKFRTTTEIGEVIEDYIKGKEAAKKGINRVIYLQELNKFKERSQQLSPAERIKQSYVERLRNMDKRFRGQMKDGDFKNASLKQPSALEQYRQSQGTLSASQRKLNMVAEEKSKDQLSATRAAYKPSIQSKVAGSQQGSRATFKLNRGASAKSLRSSQRVF